MQEQEHPALHVVHYIQLWAKGVFEKHYCFPKLMKKEIQGWCKFDISPHLMLLHSVDKILHVNANLSLSGNLPDERVLE